MQHPTMKWNAWGDPAAAKPLSDGIKALLSQALGVTGSSAPELSASDVRLRPSTLAARDRDAMAIIVGSEHCSTDDHARLLRAGGIVAFGEAFGGGLLADPAARDPRTLALRDLSTALVESEQFAAVFLPVGGGVLAATKRAPR